jgi:bifunctional DNA-binding transcriptional regulator/antitoxin component of YhaV-PrlF toxin-antitoxin module
MVKVQKLPSGQLVVTIPKVLADYEGLKKGAELEFKKHKEGFILKIKEVNK